MVPERPRRDRVLTLLTVGLGAIAAGWLGYEFWRLLIQSAADSGAIDLRFRQEETRGWFAGRPIYREFRDAMYPPASYVMMWPFVGWLDFTAARYLWAALSIGSLVWLTWLARWLTRAAPGVEGRFVTALVLATYPIGATIGNGQLSVLVVCCLLTCVGLLARVAPSWPRDLAITALFVFALIKPSVSAFFFWILLLTPGGYRAAYLTIAIYGGLTALATLAQPMDVFEAMAAWLERGTRGTVYGATKGEGSIYKQWVIKGEGSIDKQWVIKSVNLHSVMLIMHLKAYLLIGTTVVLGVLGIWVWRHRRSSLFCIAAVVALTARFSAYHSWYDDVLLLIPWLALYRLRTTSHTSAALCALFGLSLLAPGGVYLLPWPWSSAYVVAQTVCWLAGFAWLVRVAARPSHDPA